MKTKLVYVLVSEESDYYYEMVRISIYSYRLFHPYGKVEIVMDSNTYCRLKDIHDPILDNVSLVSVSIPEDFNVMQRSRYLKTNLRELIEDDFLFIDGDTIICSRLDDIDFIDADVAMVSDCNKPLPLTDYKTIELNKNAGFLDSENLPYYNSGVIYAKDTILSRNLYKEWFMLWNMSANNGVPNDQPALCQANKNNGYPIIEIPGIWNWQMLYGRLDCIFRMKILHYYMAYEWKKSILKRVKGKEYLDFFTKVLLKHPRLLCIVLFCKWKFQLFVRNNK